MTVSFASGQGWAGTRNFDYSARQNTEAARAKQAENVEIRRSAAPCKPAHCRGLEEHSREWMEACDKAFCEAMEANPTVRPSAGALTLNSIGSSR